MTVADSIAEFLAEKGITHAFGIIGAGNAALFDAIARRKATEIVCCHHEQAAVMAATAYARTSKDGIGCAIVTTGAGSSNAITGALGAYMDSVPVLIISGNEPSRYLDTQCRIVGVQGFRTETAIERFVKPSFTCWDVSILEHAYKVALDERQGPVWIDCPRDIFNALVD